MSDEKRIQAEEIESPQDNEPLDATELEDEGLEEAAGGGDIACNIACDAL